MQYMRVRTAKIGMTSEYGQVEVVGKTDRLGLDHRFSHAWGITVSKECTYPDFQV